LIDVHATRFDALEAQARHAVHVGRQQNAVPVDRGVGLEPVAHPQRHGVTFAPAQQGTGDAAVDGHRGTRLTSEVDRGFADEQLEVGAVQFVELTGAVECPHWRAPQAEAAEQTAGGQAFDKGAS